VLNKAALEDEFGIQNDLARYLHSLVTEWTPDTVGWGGRINGLLSTNEIDVVCPTTRTQKLKVWIPHPQYNLDLPVVLLSHDASFGYWTFVPFSAC